MTKCSQTYARLQGSRKNGRIEEIQSRCKKVHRGHSIMLQKCSEENFTLEQNRICSLDKLKSSRIQLLGTF